MHGSEIDTSFLDELFGYHAKLSGRMKLLLESQENIIGLFDDKYLVYLHHAIVLRNLSDLSLADASIKNHLNQYLDYSISKIEKDDLDRFERAIDDIQIMPFFEWLELSRDSVFSSFRSYNEIRQTYLCLSDHFREIRSFINIKVGAVIDVTFENFDEIAYRKSNPDVDNCVVSGQFSSGFEHFREWGVNERRTMRIFL